MRTPRRRATFMALGVVLTAAWGLSVMGQPWFGFQPHAAQDFMAGSFRLAYQVPDLGILTGWDLTLPGTGGNPVSGQPAMSEFLALPVPLAMLAAGALLALLAAASGSAVFAVAGLIAVNFGRSALVLAVDAFANPAMLGRFSVPYPAAGEFSTVMWASMLLLGALAVQLAYARHAARREAAGTARQEAGVLDALWSGMSRSRPSEP